MNFKTIKESEPLVLEGCTISTDRHDDTVMAITIQDAAGRVLRITSPYGFTLLAKVQEVQ